MLTTARVRQVGVLLGALVILGVLATGVVLLRQDGEAGRVAQQPDGLSATPVPTPVRQKPKKYPTHGEYVPPVRTTPRATPTKTSPRATVTSPPARRTTEPPKPQCPRRWQANPWGRRWCERNGYEVE